MIIWYLETGRNGSELSGIVPVSSRNRSYFKGYPSDNVAFQLLILAEALAPSSIIASGAPFLESTTIMWSFLGLWGLAHHESWTFLIPCCLSESNEPVDISVLSHWTQTNGKKGYIPADKEYKPISYKMLTNVNLHYLVMNINPISTMLDRQKNQRQVICSGIIFFSCILPKMFLSTLSCLAITGSKHTPWKLICLIKLLNYLLICLIITCGHEITIAFPSTVVNFTNNSPRENDWPACVWNPECIKYL